MLAACPGRPSATCRPALHRLRRVADHRARCCCARCETFRRRFCQVYGLTETTGADHPARRRRPRPRRPARAPAALGRRAATRGSSSSIVDPATASAPAAGEVGEVWIRSSRHRRLLGPAGGDGRRARRATAGSAPATPATSTPRATCSSTDRDQGHDRHRAARTSTRSRSRTCSLTTRASPTSPSSACPTSAGARRSRRSWCARPGADGRRARSCIAYAAERLAGFKRPTSVDFVDDCPATRAARCSSASCASRTGPTRDRAIS